MRQVASSVILYRMKDPRLGFVTVTKADVAQDLRSAKVYVSVLGDEADRVKVLRALQHGRGYIQHEIARDLKIHHTPKITFHLDTSAEKGIAISKLIDEVASELPPQPESGQPDQIQEGAEE